jgi:uncharacterized damage-inducible protein DinB
MVGFDFNAFFAGLAANEKSLLSKDAVLSLLRDGGESWSAWVEDLPANVLAEEVEMPKGADPQTKSRFEMLLGTKEHEMHHRGQLMIVERLLGIVPHLTRNRQRAAADAQKGEAAG